MMKKAKERSGAKNDKDDLEKMKRMMEGAEGEKRKSSRKQKQNLCLWIQI
jgi:hypothetical protein